MDIRNLVVDAYATVGNSLILIDVLPAYTYENGKRTDRIEGYRYIVVLPDHGFDKISIKIPGKKLFERPERDNPIVVFENLKLSVVWSPDGYKVSATATGIHKK